MAEQWQIKSLNELTTNPVTIKYVIKDVFTRGSLNLVYGEPGSKKSLLMLDAALCVATGKDWLQALPVRQSIVLWVDCENGEALNANRIQAFIREYNIDAKYIDKMFNITSFPSPSTFDNKNRNDTMAALKEAINRTCAQFIVFDNLSAISGEADQNGSGMQEVLQPLLSLAKKDNLTIVVIHHSVKSSPSVERGHGSIRAAADMLLHVNSVNGDKVILTTPVKVRIKPVAMMAQFAYTLDPVDKQNLQTASFSMSAGAIVKTEEQPHHEVMEILLKEIAANPGQNQTSILNNVREKITLGDKKTIRKIAYALENKYIKVELGARNAKNYYIDKRGQEDLDKIASNLAGVRFFEEWQQREH